MNNPLKNDTRFDDLSKVVTKLGKDAANGQDALPRLAYAVAQAAFDGVIDTTPKHDLNGSRVDDAALMYDTYVKAEGKKQFASYTANGVKANTSKLRQFVVFGMNTNIDPLATLDRARTARDELAKSGTKVLGAYPALVNVARKQNDDPRSPLTDEQLREAVAKQPGDPKDVNDYVERARNTLEKLITGENSDGARCQDERIINAFEQLNGFLEAQTAEKELAQLLAKAAALGVTVQLPGENEGEQEAA